MAALAAAEADADSLRAEAREQGLREGREEALAALTPALEALAQAAEAVAGRPARARRAPRARTPSTWRCSWPRRSSAARSPSSPTWSSRPCAARCAASSSASGSPCSCTPRTSSSSATRWTTCAPTLGGIEHCEVQAERRVSRGGAVVRTPDGDVDARVETKLQRAREVVEAALSTGS